MYFLLWFCIFVSTFDRKIIYSVLFREYEFFITRIIIFKDEEFNFSDLPQNLRVKLEVFQKKYDLGPEEMALVIDMILNQEGIHTDVI